MDVPVYAIERAYEKDNIEVASGTNWLLDETRKTTPIALIPDPVEDKHTLPEIIVVVSEPAQDNKDRKSQAVVYFDTDKHALKASEKEKLDALPKGSAYKVYGYADPRGTVKYNYNLSISRAKAVSNYLKAEGKEVIEMLGFGETKPSSKNAGEYYLDRRVDVKSE